MIEPRTSGHRNGGVARKDAGRVSAASTGIHLTWILPICPETLGAGRPLVRPNRNRNTSNDIRRSACLPGNSLPAHMHTIV